MPAITWGHRADGVVLEADGLVVRLAWEAPGIARVAALPAALGEPEFHEGPMLDPSRTREAVSFRQWESEGFLFSSDGSLTVRIDLSTGGFTWLDHEGRTLFQEDGKSIESRVDEGFRARLGFRFSDGEAIYGLGQHEDGLLDYRGRSQEIYQHNLKIGLPFMVSSRGWGLLWNGYSAMDFHDDESGSFLAADAVEQLEYFVIAGGGPADAVRGYRRLTGAAPIPPRWAFGYIQSKERYADQEELLDTARRYAGLGLPLECIVLDWQYWNEGLWGQKSFDAERFPDPKAMCDELHEMGTRLMISVWPHLSGDGDDQREFASAGKLLENGGTYDAFDPEARALFWKQAGRLWETGMDAWWADSSEPFDDDWHGELEPSRAERRRVNVEVAERQIGPLRVNGYPLAHTQGFWDHQRAGGSGKRVFNLTRSAWAGQQRYGTVPWSGDISATWETLRRQIPEGLNFAASGQPYWNCDIGAFFVKRGEQWFWAGDFDGGAADLGYRELFLRWFQYAAFLPMMRAHGTDTPREIWQFGEPGEAVYDALEAFIRLRKALLPYLYSTAGQVYFDGASMIRPLAFDFTDDPAALGIADQFLLGPSLMVCPVTEPQHFGPESTPLEGRPATRPVYLPAGEWIDCWSGARLAGEQWIDAPAPLAAIPVFARAGAIVPMAEVNGDPDDLDVLVFPGADGEFALYEDEADGWGYESGARAWIRMYWNDAQRTLTIAEPDGVYPGMPERRRVRARLVAPGAGWREEAPVPVSGEYTGAALRLVL